MSDVTPVNGAHSPALPPFVRPYAGEATGAPGPVRTADKVELSRSATFISQLLAKNDVRKELVARVRDQIASGTYETPEKLDAALDEVIEDLED